MSGAAAGAEENVDAAAAVGSSHPPRLPKFADEVEADQRLARHADRLERRLQGRFTSAEAADEGRDDTVEAEDRLPEALGVLSDWKRARDAQLGAALADAVTLAEMEKAEGNRLFGEKRSQEAYRLYKRGVDALDQFELPTLGADARRLKVLLCCNAAQALLSSGLAGATSDGAREMAEKALAIEPTNVKALFRRGCAHANAEDWNLARDDFQHVLRLDPKNEAARRELQKLRARRAAGSKARVAVGAAPATGVAELAAEPAVAEGEEAGTACGAVAPGEEAASGQEAAAAPLVAVEMEAAAPLATATDEAAVADRHPEAAGEDVASSHEAEPVARASPCGSDGAGGASSAIRGWCLQHELPDVLAERLEAEEVRAPRDLVELSEAEIESLCGGLKLGPKGRFKGLVRSLR